MVELLPHKRRVAGSIPARPTSSQELKIKQERQVSTWKKRKRINKGQAFMQGIIIPYFRVDGDMTDTLRVGGFGSTDA